MTDNIGTMIRISCTRGQRRPVFICDSCGREITSSADGVILTPECDGQSDELLRTHEVHKGACQIAFAKSLGGNPDATDLWLHLSTLMLDAMPGSSSIVTSTAFEPFPIIGDREAEFLRIRKDLKSSTTAAA